MRHSSASDKSLVENERSKLLPFFFFFFGFLERGSLTKKSELRSGTKGTIGWLRLISLLLKMRDQNFFFFSGSFQQRSLSKKLELRSGSKRTIVRFKNKRGSDDTKWMDCPHHQLWRFFRFLYWSERSEDIYSIVEYITTAWQDMYSIAWITVNWIIMVVDCRFWTPEHRIMSSYRE